MMTTTTKGMDDHNEEAPPQGGKICKEGQGEEERSESAKEVCCAAVQVHDGDAVFLLMAEAMVVNATASWSTIQSRALLLLGAGMMTIILGLLSLQQRLSQQQQQRAGSTDDGSNIAALVINGGNFWFGLSPLL
jgi:hypothetical protein